MATKKKVKKRTSKKSLPVAPAPSILSEARPHRWTNGGTEVLLLRRLNQDRKAHGGFLYPSGVGSPVEPDSWNPEPNCGGGLHGWPWGFGLGEGQDYDLNDVWLVLGAKPEDVVGELEGGLKAKCRHATIRYDGSFAGAMEFIRDGFHTCIVEMARVTVPVGAPPTPTASDMPRASLAASGYSSRLAASGDSSQLAATGENSVVASTGLYGRAKVGENGVFALTHWLGTGKGYGMLVGKVGENGIKADTWYTIRDGKIVAE